MSALQEELHCSSLGLCRANPPSKLPGPSAWARALHDVELHTEYDAHENDRSESQRDFGRSRSEVTLTSGSARASACAGDMVDRSAHAAPNRFLRDGQIFCNLSIGHASTLIEQKNVQSLPRHRRQHPCYRSGAIHPVVPCDFHRMWFALLLSRRDAACRPAQQTPQPRYHSFPKHSFMHDQPPERERRVHRAILPSEFLRIQKGPMAARCSNNSPYNLAAPSPLLLIGRTGSPRLCPKG